MDKEQIPQTNLKKFYRCGDRTGLSLDENQKSDNIIQKTDAAIENKPGRTSSTPETEAQALNEELIANDSLGG